MTGPFGALSPDKLALLARLKAKAGLCETTSLPRRPADLPIPLSYPQERLWLLSQVLDANPCYHIAAALRLRGPLDVPALRTALDGIVARHAVLRTTFGWQDGDAVQHITANATASLVVHDLRGEPPRRGTELAALAARAPFDLTHGPLLRAQLHILGPREHQLIVVVHHIAADGWSLQVLLSELANGYRAAVRGVAPSLAALPVEYADFAVWQRDQVQSGDLDDQFAYWRGALAGAPTRVDLPADGPRSSRAAMVGERVVWRPEPELVAALHTLAARTDATLFMVLVAGLVALLHRYTGQTDLVVGAPVANRDRAELTGLVGCFINLLPIRVTVDPAASFQGLLRSTRDATMDALAHQDIPFDVLVERLRPQREAAGGTPWCNVALALQNTGEHRLDLPGLDVAIEPLSTGTTRFDLNIQLAETADGLTGLVDFASELFAPSTVTAMLAAYTTLLRNAAAAPQTSVTALPLLAPRTPGRPEPIAAEDAPTLSSVFARQAIATPDAVAARCDGRELTYRELDRGATRVARQLIARGAGPESLVAIVAQPGLLLVAGILGILRSGAAYVPLDPGHPAARRAGILRQCGARILVADEEHGADLSELDSEVLGLAEPWVFAATAEEPLPDRGHPDNLAYVIHTSGSTGAPKGVAVTHRNVLSLLASADRSYTFTAADSWSLTHSAAFDVSVWEMWGAWSHGARLVVVPAWQRRAPDALVDLLTEEGVTVLSQTPTAFSQVVAEDQRRQAAGIPPKWALRHVVLAGEAMEPAVLRGWCGTHGDRAPVVVNMYGITETTVHSTYHAVSTAELTGSASIVGKPLAGVRLDVLDRLMRPVPAGMPGEIYVGGPVLTRGYLGRPGLTASRFVPDPVVPGNRVYRSGDLARVRPNGDLEYLGRADLQVKIRGFRVEPREIDAVLRAQPGVTHSATVYLRDEGGRDRLVGYVVATGALDEPALRAATRAALPDYMVPDTFVALDRLPMNANGKLDRAALPPPGPVLSSRDYTPPAVGVEEQLALLCAEVLGVERVGRDDNFFDLGGHSLLAVRLVQRVRDELGLAVPVRAVLESRTLRGLAEALTAEPADELAIAALPRGEVDLNTLAGLTDELSLVDLRNLVDGR